ncbi:hypothetical protein C0991_011748, partial [Blastosporella zonata]
MVSSPSVDLFIPVLNDDGFMTTNLPAANPPPPDNTVELNHLAESLLEFLSNEDWSVNEEGELPEFELEAEVVMEVETEPS